MFQHQRMNMTDAKIDVLDKGFVSLIDYMGGDLSVVNAARVSHAKRHHEIDLEKDPKLINYLVKHRHTSPFEHTAFTLHVKAPLFVRSQWERHRTWSYNEISGRYVDLSKVEFYIPDAFRRQSESNRQGSIPVPADDPWQYDLITALIDATEDALARYNFFIEEGVAKEMARMILPQNMYTEYYATVDGNNLIKFLDLRSGEDAQWEIRQYANALRELVRPHISLTMEAWDRHNGS